MDNKERTIVMVKDVPLVGGGGAVRGEVALVGGRWGGEVALVGGGEVVRWPSWGGEAVRWPSWGGKAVRWPSTEPRRVQTLWC
jgi:hypothetical protein